MFLHLQAFTIFDLLIWHCLDLVGPNCEHCQQYRCCQSNLWPRLRAMKTKSNALFTSVAARLIEAAAKVAGLQSRWTGCVLKEANLTM